MLWNFQNFQPDGKRLLGPFLHLILVSIYAGEIKKVKRFLFQNTSITVFFLNLACENILGSRENSRESSARKVRWMCGEAFSRFRSPVMITSLGRICSKNKWHENESYGTDSLKRFSAEGARVKRTRLNKPIHELQSYLIFFGQRL